MKNHQIPTENSLSSFILPCEDFQTCHYPENVAFLLKQTTNTDEKNSIKLFFENGVETSEKTIYQFAPFLSNMGKICAL